jgi:hypothetical protein
MPLIIPANSITGGYEVANSLRFDDGSSDYLDRTGGTATDGKKFTYSAWFKRGNLGSGKELFCIYADNTNRLFLRNNGDTFELNLLGGFGSTTREFRDPSAWYHFVIACDSTQATASDRGKWYLNGELIMTGSISLNQVFPHGQSTPNFIIGNGEYNNTIYSNHWDGYQSEVCFIDGQQLAPSDFGEFDEDSGIWKPIDVSGLTFGTNGFYLDFENSGSLGADVSGNGNNFTVNNLTSVDQSTDTCTNNFATMNPLSNVGLTITEGSLKGAGAGDQNFRSTFAVNKGKWYWEVKLGADGGVWGICNENVTMATDRSSNAGVYGIQNASGSFAYFRNNGSTGESAGFPNPVSGNIMNMAFDADNAKLYIGINGTYYNLSGTTGNPATSSNPTYSSIDTTLLWLAFCEFRGASQSCELNFGSPPYTISSGNSDANNYGNFEYAVPSGYYALNTKNLAEFG